jgi:hypothetical protein
MVQHFAKIPKGALTSIRERGGHNPAVLAYVALRTYLRSDGQKWRVRLRTLAETAGTSLSTLRRGLVWLVQNGMLRVTPFRHPDGGQGANTYELLWWPGEPAAKPVKRPELADKLLDLGVTPEQAGTFLAYNRQDRRKLLKQVKDLGIPKKTQTADLMAALRVVAAAEIVVIEEDPDMGEDDDFLAFIARASVVETETEAALPDDIPHCYGA